MRNGFQSAVPFDETKKPLSKERRQMLAEIINYDKDGVISADGSGIVVLVEEFIPAI